MITAGIAGLSAVFLVIGIILVIGGAMSLLDSNKPFLGGALIIITLWVLASVAIYNKSQHRMELLETCAA